MLTDSLTTAQKMAELRLTYAQGVATVLRGENAKASCFVTHGPSLGVLREKMVGTFIREATKGKYSVGTGIAYHSRRCLSSRQCDLLVYDADNCVPLYRWEDFLIVPHQYVCAVVEVKSKLNKQHFEQLCNVHNSLAHLRPTDDSPIIPTFGYALNGVSFKRFAEYSAAVVKANFLKCPASKEVFNLPVCVCVHDKRYLAIRPSSLHEGISEALCLVDCSKAKDALSKRLGTETGMFIEFYKAAFLDQHPYALEPYDVYPWFNSLEVLPGGKLWIGSDGEVHSENVPDSLWMPAYTK